MQNPFCKVSRLHKAHWVISSRCCWLHWSDLQCRLGD